MKQHKLYTGISLLMMICFTVAISIFTDWLWAPFLAAGGYILRTMAEGLDERASSKALDNYEEMTDAFEKLKAIKKINAKKKKD